MSLQAESIGIIDSVAKSHGVVVRKDANGDRIHVQIYDDSWRERSSVHMYTNEHPTVSVHWYSSSSDSTLNNASVAVNCIQAAVEIGTAFEKLLQAQHTPDNEMTTAKLQVDDRVAGGQADTEDYDTGRVTAIDGDQVTVAWDSLVITTQPADLLTQI